MVGSGLKMSDRYRFRKRRVDSGLAVVVTLALGNSPFVFLEINFIVPTDFDPHIIGQGIGDGGTDSVQTAGNFVSGFGKFTAGMQFGHGQFQGGNFGCGMNIHRNTPAVILDRNRIICMQGDPNMFGETG